MNRVAAFDEDLVADHKTTPYVPRSGLSVDAIMQSVRNFTTLSEALRILGAAVILASMSVLPRHPVFEVPLKIGRAHV